MNIAVLAALVLGLAQGDGLEAKKAEKLKSEFLKKAPWSLDYDKAREEAKKRGTPIFAVFSRSYSPCPACNQLENGPLLTDDFVKFSKDYVLFCHITTMIPNEKYGDLLEEKGGNAFPYIIFMDPAGDVIVDHQGPRSAEGFGKTGEKAKAWMTAKAKADAGDAAGKIDFVILQLSMGKLKVEDAEKAIKAAGEPTAEQKAALGLELTNAEIRDAVGKLRSDEEAAALGKKFYARYKEGKPSPTSDNAFQAYFMLMMDAAAESKDAKVFEEAYKAMFEKYGKLEGAAGFFKDKERQLKELQKK